MALTVPIDTGWHPLVEGIPPGWASGWGRDRHGLFAELTVEVPGDWRGVVQRLRWIPPGQFRMGSPEDEPERYNQESPLIEISLVHGFWLFDAPVTQALWQAVMGDNPSEYKSAQRPVETVSWDDAQRFIAAMNTRFAGLDLRLPSEAEWEYTCRAETTTATYAGPLEIVGTNNAPVLDAIAWYGGNCGRNWDLENGFDISVFPDKQYDDQKGGTRPVKGKHPNSWGLYDMLGIIWEWCADVWSESHEGANIRGHPRQAGSQQDASRVIRGGSWRNAARVVRAASRYGLDAGSRSIILGFRCAGGHVVSSGKLGTDAHGREAEPRLASADPNRAERG